MISLSPRGNFAIYEGSDDERLNKDTPQSMYELSNGFAA
jgi:hypothetical protein